MKNLKLHAVIFVFALGFFLGVNLSSLKSAENDAFKYLEYFHFVYNSIRTEYVDEVSPAVLLEGAIRGLLLSLNDPYSRYMDEETYSDFKKNVSGEFVGIGIEITKRDGVIRVITPLENSPAKRAGIIAGDIILKINNTVVEKNNFSEVTDEIKGRRGTTVEVYVKRDGFDEPLLFKVKRDIIKVDSVSFGVIKDSGIGYVKIAHFYGKTALELENALKKLSAKDVSSIILDLRGNPGGDMYAAVKCAELFLNPGKVIVTTKGREGSKINRQFKSENEAFYSGELIVLADEGSASSSEILTGALQDNSRAKVIGVSTFGKALVQKVVDIGEGKTAFALTVSRYYTPSDKMIHKKGIAPDIEVRLNILPKDDRKNLGRILNDGLISEFAKNHREYNQDNIELLIIFLNERNLPISRRTAAYFYKAELNRNEKFPLYDMEFDEQLKKAVEILNEK